MFTGLIQAVGQVHRRANGLLVQGCAPFSPLKLGESVAVDGVCLTAAELIADGFFAAVSEETLSRTTLGKKAEQGGMVNLEPALRFSDRLGGHLVSGHVDGLGEVVSLKELPNSWKLELRWEDASFARYMCEKASVSVNGISLTVAGCSNHGQQFFIAVIPHTWNSTSLKSLKVGTLVNLESDLIAKYTEKLLSVSALNVKDLAKDDEKLLTSEWLANQGWH